MIQMAPMRVSASYRLRALSPGREPVYASASFTDSFYHRLVHRRPMAFPWQDIGRTFASVALAVILPLAVATKAWKADRAGGKREQRRVLDRLALSAMRPR